MNASNKKKIKNASCKFKFVPSFCSWHFGGKLRKWNAWLCIPYPGDWRLQGIYHFLHFKYWISYLFSIKISLIVYRLLLKVKTSYYLMLLHVTNYSTTRLKISLKVSYQFMEKDIQTRVEVNVSYIVLGKKKLKLLITPQNRFINQYNTWLYC